MEASAERLGPLKMHFFTFCTEKVSQKIFEKYCPSFSWHIMLHIANKDLKKNKFKSYDVMK